MLQGEDSDSLFYSQINNQITIYLKMSFYHAIFIVFTDFSSLFFFHTFNFYGLPDRVNRYQQKF